MDHRSRRRGRGGRSPWLLAALSVATLATSALAVVLPGTAQAASSGPVTGGASGRCIDVSGGDSTNGGQLELWDCNNGSNQSLTLTSAGELQVLGKCLDDYALGTSNGSKVVIWDCNGGSNQQWRVGSNGTVINQLSGLCLDATGQGTANGTLLQLWACNGQSNQTWSGAPLGGGTNPPPTTPPVTTTPTGGGSTSCNVSPVDPKATPQAKNLLCYLYSIYGNHILSGQEETNNSEQEMTYIHNASGKYPAIRGADLDDRPGSVDREIAWWNAGGIPMMGWHMGAPTHNELSDFGVAVSINKVLTPGTAEYNSFISRLDAGAAQLQRAQAAGVAILWRPWHEAGGNWFWWSMEGGAQYQRLWKFEFNYFTQTKGLHNLIWLMPYDGSPDASYYPGKAYVDVGGADNYASSGDHGAMNSLFNTTKRIFGNTIPVALHENGPIPDPDQLQSTATRWVLFNTWSTVELTDNNTPSFLNKVYNSPYVITRDEVPNLK